MNRDQSRPQSRIHLRDTIDEAVSGLLQRPGRAILTGLGAALGIAAVIAVLGLSSTAAGQISARFTALAAAEVTLQRLAETEWDPPAFPGTAQHDVRSLPGVTHVGVTWRVPTQDFVSTRPPTVGATDIPVGDPLTVQAVTPGYLAAIHAHLSDGVTLDPWHETHGAHVAVLGSGAAARLGVSRLDAQPTIFVGEQPLTVIGIIDRVDRASDTLLSVLVPTSTATALWTPGPASGAKTTMLIETELGAAQLVARQAKIAARPDSPDQTKAIVTPDPRTLRDQVSADLNALFLALAAVVLVIGAVGIANTSLVAVLERRREIGLRRALGARKHHIAGQFLLESGTIGLLGGLIGTTVGIVIVVLASIAQQWTPIIAPIVIYPAPLAGALTGLVAGLYPAWRAARVEPADALRG